MLLILPHPIYREERGMPRNLVGILVAVVLVLLIILLVQRI